MFAETPMMDNRLARRESTLSVVRNSLQMTNLAALPAKRPSMTDGIKTETTSFRRRRRLQEISTIQMQLTATLGLDRSRRSLTTTWSAMRLRLTFRVSACSTGTSSLRLTGLSTTILQSAYPWKCRQIRSNGLHRKK
jgi:hypothetical protein